MNETPRFMVKADDEGNGTITLYVEWLPEGFDDEGEGNRYRTFDYSREGPYNRADARSHAEALATAWADEINQRWPCEWGTNWEKPR